MGNGEGREMNSHRILHTLPFMRIGDFAVCPGVFTACPFMRLAAFAPRIWHYLVLWMPRGQGRPSLNASD